MPRRTIRQPLLARLGKAVSQGAGAFNNYQQGQRLKDLFESSDDETMQGLSDLVNPMTGELGSVGNTLLTGELAQRRADAQADALAGRFFAREGARDERDFLKNKRQAKKDLLPKYKLNPKSGQMDIKDAGLFFSETGVMPSDLKQDQIEKATEYYARTGRLPTLVGSQENGTRKRVVKGKGLGGILGGLDFNRETAGMFDQEVEDPIMEYEFDYSDY